jgi:PAS domain S-box-containing protein
MKFWCNSAGDTCNLKQIEVFPRLTYGVIILLALYWAASLFPYSIDPESKLVFSSWNAENGLPQNSVTSIIRTKDGYLWVGTYGGLVRFNGSDFKVFTPTNTSGIKGLRINTIFEDSKESLWIGTQDGGLSVYSEGKFTSMTMEDGLPGNYVTSIAEGKDGALWIGTGGGLVRLYNQQVKVILKEDGLPDNWITSLLAASDGTLWVGTRDGIAKFSEGLFTLPRFAPYDARPNGKCSVLALYEDNKNIVWIGTNVYGLISYHGGGFTSYLKPKKEKDNPPEVWSVCRDSGGVLWVGCGDGLRQFKDGVFPLFPYVRNLLQNKDMVIRALYEDRRGNFWIGVDGAGLLRCRSPRVMAYGVEGVLPGGSVVPITGDGQGGIWIGVTSAGLARLSKGVLKAERITETIDGSAVWSLCQARDGSLWVGTWGGGLIHRRAGKSQILTVKDGLPSNVIFSIYEDSGKDLWVGTNEGLACIREGRMKVFNKASGLVNNTVLYITQDHEGSFWFGTVGGISVYKNGRFKNFTLEDGLSSAHVRCIYEDSQGTFWIATYGGGLNRLKDGKFFSYSVKDGLIDDAVHMIMEDRYSNLWISTNKGIMRASRQELNDYAEGRIDSLNIASYGAAEGMISSECNGGGQPAGWKTPVGIMWFPTMKGVVSVDPDTVSLPPSPVVIEEIIQNKRLIRSSGETMNLGPGKGNLEFHYSALDFSSPEKIRYKYRLEGYDQKWIDAADRRAAFYTNLNPGNYRFEVVACNSDGIWSPKGAAVSFFWKPYFYQTIYFYLICILLFAGSIILLIRFRTIRFKKHALWLEKMVIDRTHVLAEQKKNLTLTHEELKKSHGDLKTVFEQLKTGVVIIDRDGAILFVNQPAQILFNMSTENILGRKWNEVLPFSDETSGQLSQALKSESEDDRKFTARIDLESDKVFWTEIEVMNHPSIEDQKMLYLHDMTEAYELRRSLNEKSSFHFIVGQSPAIMQVLKQIDQMSKTDASLLILGETGAGKELVARTIHAASSRRNQPFVAINCAGLTESVLTSQLFGHKKGSFTGAVSDQIGLIEAASGGTLLLDEIGDMSLEVQRTLLRVLQEKEIVRLGETSARKVDLRFIAATHRDLDRQVIEGTFRQDLLYRIRVAEIVMPPLRERREDIPLLVNLFLNEIQVDNGLICGVSRECLDVLSTYGWPGNVRELRSAMESAAINCLGPIIKLEDLPPAIRTAFKEPSSSIAEEKDADRLIEALRATRGNIIQTCKMLGVTRMTVYRWIAKYNIDINKYR